MSRALSLTLPASSLIETAPATTTSATFWKLEMVHSDDDEDLRLAIEMSMQQSPRASNVVDKANEAIDLTSDTEDDGDSKDVQRAITLSLQQAGESKDVESCAKATSPPSSTTSYILRGEMSAQPHKAAVPSQVFSGSAGLLGLDRKAMEQERLSRLGKRKRDPSSDRTSTKQVVTAPTAECTRLPIGKITSPQEPTLQYLRGAIKRTFATKYPRTNDITLDDVLQADNVDIAVISSFMWDAEWLWKKLSPVKVKQVWIMNAKDQDTQERYRREMKDTQVPNLKIHFPPMNGMIHSMHSKFMLLFGKSKLRLVVPTANMTPIDWGEVENDWQPGVMENSVFLIDLPRRADGIVGDQSEITPFGKELIYFLEKQKVERQVISGVLKFDFSNTNHIAFVHSIGGAHKGELQYPTGLPGLAKAVQDLQLANVQHIEIDYAASSLGAINDTLLHRIHLAARGESFMSQPLAADVRKNIRIYFPTSETVEKSIGRPECGGIISLTREYYNAATFPRECLRNYDSTRRGMLSHNKLLLARGIKNNGQPFAWVYVGSANVSESAWGGQKLLKSGQMGSLNIRNWECGVVMPVPSEKVAETDLGTGEVPPMTVFEGTIELPFVFPGEPYGKKQPWFFRP